jgi:hypothetical protein
VDEDVTFVSRLGTYLRENPASARLPSGEIETLNAGVDGWTTLNELAWLKAEGLRYEPDLVVLMFYTGNDPGENYDLMKAVQRVGATSDAQPESPVRDLRRTLSDVSALYTLFESGVVAKLAPPPDPSPLADEAMLSRRRSVELDRKDRGWEISATLLRQMRELCDGRGIRLVVVGIPTLENVVNDDRPASPIRTAADEAGAPVIDLLEPLRQAPTDVREHLYFPKDRHWTPVGHDAAARHVAGALSDLDLVRGQIARAR